MSLSLPFANLVDTFLRSRAGVPVHTKQFEETVKALLESAQTSLYGFYVHAGNSVSPVDIIVHVLAERVYLFTVQRDVER